MSKPWLGKYFGGGNPAKLAEDLENIQAKIQKEKF